MLQELEKALNDHKAAQVKLKENKANFEKVNMDQHGLWEHLAGIV